jgi:NaMN:DMB phosphoribosyltransferase
MSISSGTATITTALGSLNTVCIDANYKCISSMPENPHDRKNEVIITVRIQNTNIDFTY